MMQSYKKLGGLKGKRVLVRATLDISAHDKTINPADTWRIDAWLPFVEELSDQGARIILMGHRGRPDGTQVERLSLKPVYEYIKKKLSTSVVFSSEAVGEGAQEKSADLEDGQVLVLENLRFYPGEQENSTDFAEKLASLGDVYINNDFATSHRAHASFVGVPRLLPSGAGPLVEQEVRALSDIKKTPGDELVVVLGGAKAETKVKVVQSFVENGNKVLLGGVLANMFLRAEGYEVGRSVLANMRLVSVELAEHENIFLPKDVVVSRSLKQAEDVRTVLPEDIDRKEAIVDIGPQSVERFTREIQNAEKVLWNGPLGLVEVPPFREGTSAFAHAFTAIEGESFAGGGDLVTFLQEEDLRNKVTTVFTAGGAMLSFLAGEELPGLAVLQG